MAGKKIPQRNETPDEHKWDLTPLFDNDKKWESMFVEVESQLPIYQKYEGRLKESVETFKEAIDFHLGLTRKVEKLYTYAHLKSDEDKSNQRYQGFHQRALNLSTRSSEMASSMTPEIQSIPDEIMNRFMEDAVLAELRFYLEKILRYKPHTRSQAEEQILAMSREIASGPSQVFGQLDNVDLKFGTITDDSGNEMELSHGNFTTFLTNAHRELRKKAFFQYYQAYQDHKHTLAATLSNSIKKDFFYSRVRNFNDCRMSALFSDNIPETVYDNLIESVKKNLGPLFKYLNFRKKALGIKELHFYDTYVPIITDVNFHMPYEEAVDMVVSAMASLGDEYCRVLAEGLLGGWVDRYENRGKRSGAYSSGCYDSPPYILLNYDEHNLNSLYTLIHEAGHSMHSYLSCRHQPYVYHGYTIFVAEVASTANEALLLDYLIENAETKEEKMFMLHPI